MNPKKPAVHTRPCGVISEKSDVVDWAQVSQIHVFVGKNNRRPSLNKYQQHLLTHKLARPLLKYAVIGLDVATPLDDRGRRELKVPSPSLSKKFGARLFQS